MKADGCDLVSGLEESLRCVWNGDVDLDTGELQQLYNSYLDRLKRIASILESITQDTLKVLKEEEDYLTDDILFVSKGISLVIILFILYWVLQHFRVPTICIQRDCRKREHKKKLFFSLHGIWTICLVSRRMVVN